jgi:hypothetical protein
MEPFIDLVTCNSALPFKSAVELAAEGEVLATLVVLTPLIYFISRNAKCLCGTCII